MKRTQARFQPSDHSLQMLFDERSADLDMASRLETIRLDLLTRINDTESGWNTLLENPQSDGEYARAFEEFGIDVRKIDSDTAADRIRRRSISAELAFALDDWFTVRHYLVELKDNAADPLLRRLQELATAVDPDPMRVRLRDAWAKGWLGMQPEEMEALCNDPELMNQPTITLISLGLRFVPGHHHVRLLREMHSRHPDDFWINSQLGSEFAGGLNGEQNSVDALRFRAAAVALRPDSAFAHVALGRTLFEHGQIDNAIGEYREAIRLQSGDSWVHKDFGALLAQLGRLEEGIVEFREAIRLNAGNAEAHFGLAHTLARQGNAEKRSMSTAKRFASNQASATPT